MTAPGLRARRSALPVRIAFGIALVLATKPVWSFLVFGFDPSFEELLLVRCLGGAR